MIPADSIQERSDCGYLGEILFPSFNEWLVSFLDKFKRDENENLQLDEISHSTRLVLFAIRNISLDCSRDDSIDR